MKRSCLCCWGLTSAESRCLRVSRALPRSMQSVNLAPLASISERIPWWYFCRSSTDETSLMQRREGYKVITGNARSLSTSVGWDWNCTTRLCQVYSVLHLWLYYINSYQFLLLNYLNILYYGYYDLHVTSKYCLTQANQFGPTGTNKKCKNNSYDKI